MSFHCHLMMSSWPHQNPIETCAYFLGWSILNVNAVFVSPLGVAALINARICYVYQIVGFQYFEFKRKYGHNLTYANQCDFFYLMEAWWGHMATKIRTNIGASIGNVVWRHQVITSISVDLSSKALCGIHRRSISQGNGSFNSSEYLCLSYTFTASHPHHQWPYARQKCKKALLFMAAT